MHYAYSIPDRPDSPPEPTREELLTEMEQREYIKMRHRWHMDNLRRCLARSEHIRVGDRFDHVARFVPDVCDYTDTEDAAWALEEMAAAGRFDAAAIGEAYISLLELRLIHAADDLAQAEAEGKKVEYGVAK